MTPAGGHRARTGGGGHRSLKISSMKRQEELAVGRRLLGHIDGRTTDLAGRDVPQPRVGLLLPRARGARTRASVSRPADLHGPVDAAGQARRLSGRGCGRHAGADDARRRRHGAGLRQYLPPPRRTGRAGLRQCAGLHLPLSRLDLRSRRQASGHHRQGGLRRTSIFRAMAWCACRRASGTACCSCGPSRCSRARAPRSTSTPISGRSPPISPR